MVHVVLHVLACGTCMLHVWICGNMSYCMCWHVVHVYVLLCYLDSEQLGVLLSSVTLCIEGLYESCSSLHERCVQEAMLVGHLPQGHTFSASHVSYRLLQTLSEYVTSYAVGMHKASLQL